MVDCNAKSTRLRVWIALPTLAVRCHERVSPAGLCHIGEHSAEVMGDYVAGPSHATVELVTNQSRRSYLGRNGDKAFLNSTRVTTAHTRNRSSSSFEYSMLPCR